MKLSIVIPAYNEEKRIGKTLPTVIDYVKSLKKRNIETEIIVVNDGSSDDTYNVLKRYSNDVEIVTYTPNHGKGYALREGVKRSKGEYVYIADADFSTPIEYVDRFLENIEGYNCVIGSRAIDEDVVKVSFVRKIFGNMSNLLIRIILGLKFKDTQCGFKMFDNESKKYFLDCKNERWGYDFEFLYLLQKKGLKTMEMSVEWEAVGESHVKPLHYFKTFQELLNVRRIHG